MNKVTLPSVTGKVSTGKQVANLINELKSQHNLSVDKVAELEQALTLIEQNGGGATLTDEEVTDAVSRHLNGTAWKGKNGLPPTANFSITQTDFVAPALATLNDLSTAGDNDIDTVTISFSDGRTPILMSEGTYQFNITELSQSIDITLNVVDIVGNSDSIVITNAAYTTAEVANIPPTVADQNLLVEAGTDLEIRLGNLRDVQNELIDYTTTGSSDITLTGAENIITFNSATEGVQTLTVTASDGVEQAQGTIVVTVVAVGSQTYPIQGVVAETFIPLGDTGTISPYLTNPSSAGPVLWFKTYGHDDIVVNPVTGETTWDTTGYTRGESYHVGIKAVNKDGEGHVSCIVHVGKVLADIHYVGPDDLYTNWLEVHPHINSGDTVIFRDGIYQGDANLIGRNNSDQDKYPPSGTQIKMTCIMGTTPSKTIFNDGFSGVRFALWNGGYNESSYLTFNGLYFEGGSTLALNGDASDKANTRPHHMKVIHCGGNGEDYINLYSRVSDYILFEECYSFGGGRYKIASNESTYNIYRRCISRYDKSDRRPEEDPKGSFIMYNTINFRIDNSICVDDVDKYVNNGYKAGSFSAPTTSTSQTSEGASGYVNRCLQLNCEQQLLGYDYQVSNGGGAADVETIDMSCYGNRSHTYFMYGWAFSLFQRNTLSNVRLQYPKDYLIHNGGYNNWRGFVNCIIEDIPAATAAANLCGSVTVGSAAVPYGGGTSRVVEKYGILNNNITDCLGMVIIPENQGTQYEVGTTTVDPALRYVTRTEATSSLSETHGATVMTHLGRSGTFHGETGFDQETNIPMWPFPMEDIARTKMREFYIDDFTYSGENYLSRLLGPQEVMTGVRGFCADDDYLTGYVWAARGETPPPMNVKAVAGDAEATILWELPKGKHKTNVTGYKVYSYDPDTGAMSTPTTVGIDVDRVTIPSLINGFDTWFVVTAVDSVTGESGFGYPVMVVPNGVPTVAPQILVHPQDTDIVAGDTVIFTADVQGASTLKWAVDGVVIPNETGETLTFVGQLEDNNKVYSIIAENPVQEVSSTGATLSVTALDSNAPVISFTITGDVMDITLSDNLYPNNKITVELLDGGVPTGDSWLGSVASTDLTTMTLPNGSRTLSLRATDLQLNVGTSGSTVYVVGSAIFVDNFTDGSNWTPAPTVDNGVFTNSADGITRTTSNIWNAASKSSIKFDLRINFSANEYEQRRISIGDTTAGVKNGSLEIFFVKYNHSNNTVKYYDRATAADTNLGTFQGLGGAYDFQAGQEVWQEIEFIMVGTTLTINIDGAQVFTATLPENVNPFSGVMSMYADAAGDMSMRNLTAYA